MRKREEVRRAPWLGKKKLEAGRTTSWRPSDGAVQSIGRDRKERPAVMDGWRPSAGHREMKTSDAREIEWRERAGFLSSAERWLKQTNKKKKIGRDKLGGDSREKKSSDGISSTRASGAAEDKGARASPKKITGEAAAAD